MSDESTPANERLEQQMGAVQEGQETLTRSAMLPLQQTIDIQRNVGEMLMNGLELNASLGRATRDLTRSGLRSYMNLVEETMGQVAGVGGADRPGQPGSVGGEGQYRSQYGQRAPPRQPAPQQAPQQQAPQRQIPQGQGPPQQQPPGGQLPPQGAEPRAMPPQGAGLGEMAPQGGQFEEPSGRGVPETAENAPGVPSPGPQPPSR